MTSSKKDNMLIHQYVINDPLHQLFDKVNAISVQGYDEERRVIYWNEGSELLYGYNKEEATGKKLEDLIIPEPMREFVIAAHRDWIKHDIAIPAAELTLRHQNGSEVSVFSSHVMFTNQYGTKQIYCIDVDLSDVRKAQAQAIFKQHMLETIFQAIPDLFFLMHYDGTIIDFHAGNENKLNVPAEQLMGKKMYDFLPTNVAEKFRFHMAKLTQQTSMISFEYDLTLPRGLVHFEARLKHLTQYNQIVIIVRDITEQHKTAELIRHQAYFDHLTSLPNRFLALDRLSQILIEAQRNQIKTAVLFLDIDDFKKVNDSLGHETGDKLLIKVAKRLQKELRKEDTVGRLGGDEFIILLRGITDHQRALAKVEKLLNIFSSTFLIDGRELNLTVSMGVAIYPENGRTASDLLRNADTAMYQAKASGRNTYSFFTDEMNANMHRRLAIEEQMQGALERNEFTLFYQALIDVKTQKIIGAEALLRWHNVVLGQVTPDEFIPVAEQTGFIVPIGRYVIKQALIFLAEWQNTDQKKYSISVNLSPRQLRDTTLFGVIKHALVKTGIAPENLHLEITEGVLMNAQGYIQDFLNKLSDLGVKLAMDDFGTGYSSLNYLRQFPFDVLKIDRSFIDGIAANNADEDLVKATIAMSHSLGLTVVAEGVETQEQLSVLENLGCDFVQGYYFSKPITGEQLLVFSAPMNKK